MLRDVPPGHSASRGPRIGDRDFTFDRGADEEAAETQLAAAEAGEDRCLLVRSDQARGPENERPGRPGRQLQRDDRGAGAEEFTRQDQGHCDQQHLRHAAEFVVDALDPLRTEISDAGMEHESGHRRQRRAHQPEPVDEEHVKQRDGGEGPGQSRA